MVWTAKHSLAVQELKDASPADSLARIFDPDKPITTKTDASKHAVGAGSEQEGKHIAFESRKSGPREQFLPAHETELLAVIHALLKRRQLIGHRKVRVETDHATLGRLLQQKDVAPRLGYWLDNLAVLNLEVVYRPEKQNVADAISRRPRLCERDPGWGTERANEAA